LAFFIGLSKIQVLAGGTISGLPGLINGLSGKFVTSIVGLACASIFVIFEKGLLHRLLMTYHTLVDRVDQVFPYRGSSEWLFEMSQHNAEQTRALKYLTLDLAQHLRKSLTDIMAAPLVDLAGAVRQFRTGVSAQMPIADSEVQDNRAKRKLPPSTIDHDGNWEQLNAVFDRLETSAIRQEQLMTRLADILVPWTEISPKGRLAMSSVGRPLALKPVPLPISRHSA
jgi:hypothetical protein